MSSKAYTTADIYGIESLYNTHLFQDILAYYPKDLAKIIIRFLNPRPSDDLKEPKLYLVYKDEWEKRLLLGPKHIFDKMFYLIIWANVIDNSSDRRNKFNVLICPSTLTISNSGSMKMDIGSLKIAQSNMEFNWEKVVSIRDNLEVLIEYIMIKRQLFFFKKERFDPYPRPEYIFSDKEGTILVHNNFGSQKHDTFYIKKTEFKVPFNTEYIYIQPGKKKSCFYLFHKCCTEIDMNGMSWEVLNRVSRIILCSSGIKFTIEEKEQRNLQRNDYAIRSVVYKVPLKGNDWKDTHISRYGNWNYKWSVQEKQIMMESLDLFWCGIPIIFESNKVKKRLLPPTSLVRFNGAGFIIYRDTKGAGYDIYLTTTKYIS